MSPAPIRCGVVGTGSLGQHHARIYASLPGAVLAGIVEADDARAAEICGRLGCRRFASLDELAAHCDAASIVVPTDRHAEVALPLLAKGVDLLVEKPLCASLDEAGRIVAAAAQAGRIVQVGHIEHYNPVMAQLERTSTSWSRSPSAPRSTRRSASWPPPPRPAASCRSGTSSITTR